MRTVWKFPFKLEDEELVIPMPRGARVIMADTQPSPHGSQPCLWAEIPDDADAFEERHFAIVGTGHPVPDEAEHIASFQMQDMFGTPFVWHIYER